MNPRLNDARDKAGSRQDSSEVRAGALLRERHPDECPRSGGLWGMGIFSSTNFDGQRGVTLKELTLVLVLVGFFAAVALPRYSKLNADAVSDAETLKATLRYVRTRALSDVYTWQLQVAGSTCTVQRNTATPTSYTIAFTTSGVAAGTTTFDNRGQPTGTLSYAVTGYPQSPVTITTGTGFVP